MPVQSMLRSCQPASASLPACIQAIIKSPEQPPQIPSELDEQFSRFSFSSPSTTRIRRSLSPLSSATSSRTTSRTASRPTTGTGTGTVTETETSLDENDIPRLTIGDLPTLTLDGIPNLFPENSNNQAQNDPDLDTDMPDTNEIITSRRRSSQEKAQMELDKITDDLRRIEDGMSNSLNRYINKWTLYLLNHLTHFNRAKWSWPRLKSNLKSLRLKLTTLLSLVEQQKLNDVECDAIKIKLEPSINNILREGFSILAMWNARDKSLTIKKIVHFEMKERRKMILGEGSCSRLGKLVDLVCECEKLVVVVLKSMGRT